MGFRTLIDRVQHAEAALETREHAARRQWTQLQASWRSAWTPGRIVVVGLAAGFVIGRSRPLALAGSAGVLKLVNALSGVVSSELAQALASHFAPTDPATDGIAAGNDHAPA